MDAVFVDIETTGDDPLRYQMYEFAAVPVIGGVIRKDLMMHCYLEHRSYKIQREIFAMVSERLNNPRPGVTTFKPHEWARIFRNRLTEWVDTPATLGGKNFGSFDMQFMLNVDESLKHSRDLLRYSYLDIGSLTHRREDPKVLSLKDIRQRAIEEGAPISVENSHYADDDALLCAEIYCWEMYERVLYGRQCPVRADTIKLYQEKQVG